MGTARASAITVGMAAACLPTSTARAAQAPAGCRDGVAVVVEFRGLDHPDVRSCEPSTGGNAARLLRDAGLTLTDVQRQPGFVCRVDGLPAGDPCVNTPPASAYWSLWWSDGSTGEWTYSTVAAASLEVPAGGSVALVWDDVPADLAPAAPPGTATSGTATSGSATPGAGDAGAADPVEPDPAEPDDGGLPVWAGPAALGLLLVAGAAGAVARRRRGDAP